MGSYSLPNDEVTLYIDLPEPGVLRIELHRGGSVVAQEDIAYQGPVDNLLLTAVDNLVRRHRVDRFALKSVELGQGIDKNSSLYRIVTSFAAAVAVASEGPERR